MGIRKALILIIVGLFSGCTPGGGDSNLVLAALGLLGNGGTATPTRTPSDTIPVTKMLSISTGSTPLTFLAGINDDGDKNNDGDTLDTCDEPGGTTIDYDFEITDSEVTYKEHLAIYNWAKFGTGGATGEGVYTFYDIGAVWLNQNELAPKNFIFVWIDAVVWTNAKTEYYNAMNGTSLAPVYYADSNYTTPLRDASTAYCSGAGTSVCTNPYIKAATTGNTDMANNIADGFRLPTADEWELAARYQGSDSSNGAYEYPASSGHYWTPGSYASGATADTSNSTATGNVAWYSANTVSSPVPQPQVIKQKRSNKLELYDMSGNVSEYVFDWDPDNVGTERMIRGGNYADAATDLQLGAYAINISETYIGIRVARTP